MRSHPRVWAGHTLTISCSGSSAFLDTSGANWFSGTPWTNVSPHIVGHIVSIEAPIPRLRLLGGSSKLAKLAEERRRKAAEGTTQTPQDKPQEASSSLDRLSKPKETKENHPPGMKAEQKKYPIRRKKSPTPPPPSSPSPPPEEPQEDLPDLRISPTAFGRTLSRGSDRSRGQRRMSMQAVFGPSYTPGSFDGPSPDDTVLKAQERSKGLNK